MVAGAEGARAARAVDGPIERDDPRALLAVFAAITTWAYSSIVIKAIATPPLVTAFWRVWSVIPLLWLWRGLLGKRQRPLGRHWLRGSVTGGLLFASHQIFFFHAVRWTSVANVTLVGALQPALVLLVSRSLFGERVSGKQIMWSMVAVAGSVLVVVAGTGQTRLDLLGDLFAIGNLFAFTGYFLVSKQARRWVEPFDYVVGMTTVSGLVMAAVCLVRGDDVLSPRGVQWLLLLSLGILPGTVGHLATSWAHAHARAMTISVVMLAGPVLSSLAAWAVLGERIVPLQGVGATVVLISIALALGQATPNRARELAEAAAETDAP